MKRPVFSLTAALFPQQQRATSIGNLCYKLTVSYLTNKFPSFMETECLLPCLRQSGVCPTLRQMKPGRLSTFYCLKMVVLRFPRNLGATLKFQATRK